jgi:RHS repeat-associated protein
MTYGAAVPTITPSFSGFVNGQTSASLTTQPTCTTTYTTTSAAGSSPTTSCSGAASANYTISYVAGAVTVNQATPTITWTPPAPITYGTVLSGTQLNASLSIAGSCVYTPAGGTVLNAGTQTLSVNCTPADTVDYATPVTVTMQLMVNQSVPVITWAVPAAINSGTALSATQLDATSTVAGTFAYIPASGTVLAIGTQTLSVTFTPTDTVNYTTATASVSLMVNQTQCASNGYSYQRAITIDHTKVPNTDQVNFPFLFNTTDPTLATTTNSGHVTSPNGYDIIFTSDPAGQNILNYEMEEYNPTTGQVIAWVRIPTLSHTTDTVIYVFYGNPVITSSQQNPTGVWDSHYGGVWHLGGSGTVQSLADSTANANTATVIGSVSETPGEIGNSAVLSGGSNYISAGNNPSVLPTHTGTFSIWVNYNAFTYWTAPMGNGSNASDTNGALFWNRTSGQIDFEVDGAGGVDRAVGSNLVTGQWYYLTGTWDGSTVNLYEDGTLVGSTAQTTDANPQYPLNLGIDGALSGNGDNFEGSLDEARVSGIARSADWIATEYSNQSSPSAFYAFSLENTVGIVPTEVSLYASQSQQFTVPVTGSCSYRAATWTITPAGVGTISPSGQYTAPASITTQQQVIVTATSQTGSSPSDSATVTLMPPVSVSVTPLSTTLYGGWTQQFTAGVTNTSNPAVNWTITPAGVGTISPSGLYTAPASITTQQTVTITATSQADTTQSAAATITLTPTQCASSYQRAITIDHTKVPNTDQINFPFLFSTTDQAFATIANGGHISNSNGYDIVFSLDPSGVTKLNYELEQYNPVTGQIIAWIRIPTLSHTSDTVLYMFYGNSSITTAQNNSASVWDSNYMGVWHLGETAGSTIYDSTSNALNGTAINIAPEAGQVDGAQNFSGQGSYINEPSGFADFTNGFTFELWANPSEVLSYARFMDFSNGAGDDNIILAREGTSNSLVFAYYGNDGDEIVLLDSVNAISLNQWQHFVATVDGNNVASIYKNGVLLRTTNASQAIPVVTRTNNYFGRSAWSFDPYFAGEMDELKISTVARSADWIATEYNNQGSPAAFYQLSPESMDSTEQITPAAVNLYAAQNQQFALLGMGTCNPTAINWTIEPTGMGTISQTGLYTAPSTILTQQNVTVTATTTDNNSVLAAVTLMPSWSGPAGTVITINGTGGFGSAERASSVTVGGLPAVTLFWSDTQIQVQIPTSTGLGVKSVVVAVAGQPDTVVTFNVTPGIVAITPSPTGVVASTTIDIANQTAPLIFNGVAGQLASVQLNNSTFSSWFSEVNVSILSPDGSTLVSGTLGTNTELGFSPILGPTTLPVTGTYTVVIAAPSGATGSATVTLCVFSEQTGTITSGIPKTVTINIPGQEDLLTFNGTAGQLASVQLNNSTFSSWFSEVNVSILAPNGSTLVSGTLGTNTEIGFSPILGPTTLPVTGTYTIVIAPNGATGSATVTLWLFQNQTGTMLSTGSISVTPPSATIYSDRTQQFSANVLNNSNQAVTWSISPLGAGTISAAGLYTAPYNIANQQTVMVTATSQAETIASQAPVQVTINIPGQNAQLTFNGTAGQLASVQLNISTFSSWFSEVNVSILSPDGSTLVSGTLGTNTELGFSPILGPTTLPVTGTYTIVIAPNGATGSATVSLITPTKIASQSASAMVTLSPQQCASSGYSYQRVIVIDHTKVPNTDQANFPFLFNTTDPSLATVANGGHVSSSSGYDMIFSTDPAGLTKLDHELEQYNPVTGKVIAWVRIPTLSHTADTVLYVFYGNPSVTASQQNPTDVWDSNYQAVYHLANAGTGTAADSTANANAATLTSVLASTGEIDGAGSFNGASSYMQIPSADFLSYPISGSTANGFSASFGVWFQTASAGVILGQTDGTEPGGNPGQWQPALYVDTAGLLRASLFSHGSATDQIVTTTAYNDNNWHFAVDTYADGTETLYVDGQNVNSQQVTEYGYNSAYAYFVGTGETANWPEANGSWLYFNGTLDEVNISSIARSSDWVQTEYNNQSSPSTFYALHPENAEEVIPGTVSLYDSQSQQFTIMGSAAGTCSSPAVIWSMPSGMPGTLTANGIYTAPNSISSQQTVPVTATILGDSSQSISATVFLMPPVSVSVTPPSALLYGGQTQQFTANVANTNNTAVTWTISCAETAACSVSTNPTGVGTISASGLYTAPASGTTQQTIYITATSVANTTQSASATITLAASAPVIPGSVSVTPSSATLHAGETQQLTASVANTSNTAVTWTITPAGTGTINAAGLYTAPPVVTTEQTVTISATSQADMAQSASATITLTPTQCVSSGYGYQRVIVIDHTKVPNSDQTNFPFLFNTTDADLAFTSNGGHVANFNGYDIIFSTDPNGLTKLDHEMEAYNPLIGQVIAWVRIPTLSHTADTVIYVFYGNPNIIASQQNPIGVWNSNYTAVYHLANTGTGVATDSTVNGNSGTLTSILPASGEIDGAGSFNGASSYIQIPETDFPNFPTGVYNNVGLPNTNNTTSLSMTFGVWFKTASMGGLLNQSSSITCTNYFFVCISNGPMEPGDTPDYGWDSMIYIDDNGRVNAGGIISPIAYNDNNWHYAVWTFATSGTEVLYVDGQNVGSAQGAFPGGYSQDYAYFVGTVDTFEYDNGNQDWIYFNGDLDEVTVSNTPRSGDWIQTEYNNQSSPSSFYTFKPASSALVVPSAISLYAAQSQQFAATISCNASVVWTMSSSSQGTLTSNGLYTAPEIVTGQQSVAITALNSASGTTIGNAAVTLLPPPSPITLAASGQSPYAIGSSQTFSATLQDQNGTPEIGVTVNFTVGGANSNVGSSTTGSNGIATYSYTGANSGSDTVQATAVVNGQLLTSNNVSASWVLPVPPTPAESITLMAPPALGKAGLIGAFTDSNGAVIEPIAIGASQREFIVPTGATQLQLGVDSAYFVANGGPGYVVQVNGNPVPVPATAMPWTWVTGGLNNNYQYGIYAPNIQNGILDGTNPVVAATGLTQGESVSIAYQSGTASANYPISPLVNADGDQASITGVQLWNGTYFPTLYTTTSSYPLNQPITFNALVTDASGKPTPNVPVILNVTGANAQQLQATTDSTGTATFIYSGFNQGIDSLQAQAFLSGAPTLASSQSSLMWINYPTPPPAGNLLLQLREQLEDRQGYFVLATDASGNPVFNANTGFYVWGVDNFQLSGTTDITGQGFFNYYHGNNGTYNVMAVDSANRNIVFSNIYNNQWSGLNSSSGGIITIGISANTTVTMPNTLQLNGTVTDSAGLTPTITWSQVSGPGTVTFANSNQASTTAAFSDVGSYVLQLSASDATGNRGSVKWQVTVYPPVQDPQGWIGSPVYGSTVTGVVPITLASGIVLQSGILTYYPANNTNNVTVLNANTAGSGQIGTLDTTTLVNGTYWIQLQATDANGEQQYGLVPVTVAGNYKPGRVTATVTDLVVPATGLAINIQRTYDSLNAGTSGDFGYGWNLGINVNLAVDNAGNVTFTLGGQRKTFYLAPQNGGGFFPYYYVAYTPEPGLYGKLTDSGSSCGQVFNMVVPDGAMWLCYQSSTQFTTTGYVYTDPNGTSYTISAAGNLQSIQDRSGNGLTITANGITSTTGLNVLFVRDSSNRITQITDPQGNIYQYGYDQYGNLATVTYPNTPQPSTYTYDANHLYLSGTDARSNPLPTSSYFTAADTDPNGLPLNGRLKSVTDAFNNTTSYAYILSTTSIINGVSVPNTGVTTITYPPDASGIAGTATMVYDNYGMLLSSTDPLNHTTTNVYDANHNLISTTDPLGHTTTATYDASGNKTSSTYPATPTSHNTTSTTQYNQYSEPTSTTDELGNVRAFNYDANYNPQSVTDSIGALASFIFNPNQTLSAGAIGFDISVNPAKASQFTYDGSGNMASRIDALGRTTSYVYNSLGQKTSVVTPTPASPTGGPASTTSYTYDALGNLTQTAAPLSRTTSSTYDANGNKITDTDARGYITSYVYDALNRLVETDYPDGSAKKQSFDFRNNVLTETDQAGNVTLNAYDLAGRLTSVTRGSGSSTPSTTSYEYDDASRKVSETDALSHTTSYTYDAAGRLVAIAGVKGNFTYSYDDAGNRISSTDANNNTSQFAYDARKRLIKTANPDKTTIVNTYDGPGNLASVTDQAGAVVQYTYDAGNQLNTVVQLNHPDPSHNTNSYGYDPLGNLTGLTDERIDTTSNLFNVLNQLTQKTLPDQTLKETRTYDAAGNLQTLTHFNGVTTTYTYDALNRLLTRSTPGEPTVSFTYTATGKYLTSAVGSHTTNYTYDSLDRLSTKATPQGKLSYTYYPAGQVESIQSSNTGGAWVSYTYDGLNRLSTVVDNNLPGQNTTDYTYDQASNVATVKYPSGLTSTFTYDSMNRLTELVYSPQSTPPVINYSYQLGLTGNRTQATETSGRTVNWSYDGIYRLTNETITGDTSNNGGNNGSATYTLDPVGNRTAANSNFSGFNPIAGSYNADDQLSSETYDSNGNTTLAANGNSYTYDSENHMTSATGNGKTITMAYDAFGNRVAKTVNSGTTSVTTWYLVEDDVNPTGLPQVLEEKVGGAVQRVYTYGLQRISQYLSPTVTGNSAWTPSFYVYDGAGSVRQLTDSTGTPTDEYEYDAYGNSFTKQGTTPNNYLYRGEQYDSDLGLYYLRARYYNANTGRFLSRDPEDGKPIDPKTLHKYLYVGGNPVNWIDPRGREIVEVAEEESEEDVAATKEAREAGIRLAGCFFGIAWTIGEIADENWKEALGAGIPTAFACYEFLLPEPPMPPVVPPPAFPPPPPPPGLPPNWCGLECWNPPPGTPIN